MEDLTFCTLCGGDGFIDEHTAKAKGVPTGGTLFQDGRTETCPLCAGTGSGEEFDPRVEPWSMRRAFVFIVGASGGAYVLGVLFLAGLGFIAGAVWGLFH